MKRSIFRIVMKMLFAKKQRLILTCIGVAVTIGLIIVISSLYSSMERSVQNTINQEIGTIDIVAGYSPFKGQQEKKLLTKEQISQLRSLEGVIESGEAIQLFDIALNGLGRMDGINYAAVEPNGLVRNYYQFSIELQLEEMVITEELAKRWGVKVGDVKEIPMSDDIVLKKTVGEIIPNYQSGPSVILHIDAIREEYTLGEVANAVYLVLADGKSADAVAATIRAEIDSDMDIALRSQSTTFVKEMTLFRFIAIGLGCVLLLVCILFLTSSFKFMLLGRVQELSIFRMIGATKQIIYKMVMMEAAVLNLLGTAFGVGIGVALCTISTKFINSMMGITVNNVEMSWQTIAVIAVLGWAALTLSVMRIAAMTATSSAPLVAVRSSEQQELNKLSAWIAGSLFIVGCLILCLAWLGIISNSERLLLTLLGGLLAAGGCILGTGYMIPIISYISGWFIRKFAIAEAYYAVKQFVALRRQNSFIIMLLASIVTAFIAIPAFIDNLNRANAEQVLREHMTPIVITKKLVPMSSNVVEQVRQVEGVKRALPVGSSHAVLLGDMDYERANPKWLQLNSNPPEYFKKGTSLYDTYQYQWIGVVQTEIDLMHQMGLIEGEHVDLLSGIVIQPEYARHMGLAIGDSLYLQRTSLGKRLEQVELSVSSVAELNFTVDEALAMVDYRNPKVSWLEGESRTGSNNISATTIYVQVSEKADLVSVRTALQTLLEDDPLIKVTDLDSELLRIADQSREQYTILWAVMATFVIVSIIGIINTFGSTFHAHRREYAILRAIRLTTARLRALMIVQGLLYALAALVIGMLAGAWIIVGIISGSDEFSGWTINWFTIALPIIVVVVISLLVSVLYAKQIASNSITEELTVK